MKPPIGFQLVTVGDRELICSYAYASVACISTEYAFANLRVWGTLYPSCFCVEHGRLWIFEMESDTLYFPLGGEGIVSREEISEMSDRLRNEGWLGRIIHVPQSWIDEHSCPNMDYTMSSNFGEYYYTTESLAKLSGRALSAKRNLIHQFERQNPHWEVIPIDPADLSWLDALIFAWKTHGHGPDDLLAEDDVALQYAFSMWHEVGLHGLRLTDGKETVAFSIWSLLTKNTANIHFEKALLQCKGASQMINRATARTLPSEVIWVNREQDLGIPGLRQAKLSYKPAFILTAGMLTPMDDAVENHLK